jgi:hypothetical protein
MGCPLLSDIPPCLTVIPNRNYGNLPLLDVTLAPHIIDVIVPKEDESSRRFPYVGEVVFLATMGTLLLIFCIYLKMTQYARPPIQEENVSNGSESERDDDESASLADVTVTTVVDSLWGNRSVNERAV